MLSSGGRTSSVTVFIVPPRNLALKIGDQLLRGGEGVVAFLIANVPMIAFARLIVEAQNALAIYYICEPVFEVVPRPRQRFVYTPKNQFGEGILRIDNLSTEQLSCLHVGDYANSQGCCQELQREPLVPMGPNVLWSSPALRAHVAQRSSLSLKCSWGLRCSKLSIDMALAHSRLDMGRPFLSGRLLPKSLDHFGAPAFLAATQPISASHRIFNLGSPL